MSDQPLALEVRQTVITDEELSQVSIVAVEQLRITAHARQALGPTNLQNMKPNHS